jgi:hypothetical protein
MLIFFIERVLLFFYFIAGGVDKSFISMGGSGWDRIDFIEIKKPGPKVRAWVVDAFSAS